MSGWIKCSKRMPERDGAYLVWDGRYVDKASFFFGNFLVNTFRQKNITHWQPLPSPPED